MIFIDTNVLIYTITLVPEEFAKRDAAIKIVDNGDCALSVQVLNEFVNAATRPKRLGSLTMDQAIMLTDTWRRFPIQSLDIAVFDAARNVQRQMEYSWWDSLVVAAAVTMGCETLASEDMQHGRVIDGVRIMNPFRDL